MLRRGVKPYEYMDDLEKFNESLLPEKEDFYSHINMDNTTDAEYTHTKIFCKDFKVKHLGDYHDLYVQSNALLSADVFEKFSRYVSSNI